MRRNSSAPLRTSLCAAPAIAAFLILAVPAIAPAQETGTVTGTATRAADGGELSSVSVGIPAIGLSTITGTDGKYTLRRVPAGPQTIVFRWLGYRPTEVQVVVEPNATVTADAALEAVVISLGEIVVEGASRGPERIVEAPAAISVVPQEVLQNVAITGQAPMALQSVPGVDVVQSGVNDFNVNARGFNSSLNRRVLTLQDGRDLAIAFLGAQEWDGLTQPLDDLGRVEMVRGPGSALYGANAFSGVINITTPEAREVLGSKLTLAGGELETFRMDGRHAGLPGRRPDRVPGQRRLQPERHLLAVPHPAERHLAPGGVRGGHRRAAARRRGGAAAQRPDRRPGDRRGERRPGPAAERVRQRAAGLLPRQRLGALGGRRRREGRERDLRDRHRPGAGGRGDQAVRPGRARRRPVQHLRLLEQPDLARAAVLPHLGAGDRGAVRHLPRRGAEQLELPERPRPGGLRRVVPQHEGQHLRHADEPRQRRTERRSLLGVRPGGIPDHPAGASGRSRAIRRRRPDRRPVLAQGRDRLQPDGGSLLPLLGEPRVPDAELLGVVPPGAGGAPDGPVPGIERRGILRRRPRQRSAAGDRRSHHLRQYALGLLAGRNRRSRWATPSWRSRR